MKKTQQKRRGGKTQKRRGEMKRKVMRGGRYKFAEGSEMFTPYIDNPKIEYTLFFLINEPNKRRSYQMGKIYYKGDVYDGELFSYKRPNTMYACNKTMTGPNFTGLIYDATLFYCIEMLFRDYMRRDDKETPEWTKYFSNERFGLYGKDIYIYSKDNFDYENDIRIFTSRSITSDYNGNEIPKYIPKIRFDVFNIESDLELSGRERSRSRSRSRSRGREEAEA